MATIKHTRNEELLNSPIRFTVTNITATPSNTLFYKLEDTAAPNPISPASINITTVVSANLTNPTYEWSWALNPDSETWNIISGQTASTLTVTSAAYQSYIGTGSAVSFKVKASQTGRNSSESIVTINFYDESNDTVQVYVARNTIGIQCDPDGDPVVGSLLGTSNAVTVSVNSEALNYSDVGANNSYSVDVGIDNATISSSYGLGKTFTVGNLTNISSTFATATLTVTIKNALGLNRLPRTASYTYNKIIQGSIGVDGAPAITINLLSDTDVVFANNSGDGYSLPTGNYIQLYTGSTLITSGVTYGVLNSSEVVVTSITKNGLTASVDSSTGMVTLSGTSWTTSQESFTFSAQYNSITYKKIYKISKSLSGYDSVILDLYSEADVVFANNDGTGYTLPSSNYLSLYEGGTKVTSGVIFSTTTPNVDGISVSVTASPNAFGNAPITLSAPSNSWNSNTTEIGFKAIYKGKEYPALYTISKSRKGTDSILVDLLRHADVAFSDKNGQNYTLPTANNNRIRLYKGGTILTSGVTFGPTTQTNRGLTASVDGNGLITISGPSNSWNDDYAEFTFEATYGGVDYEIGYTITKSKTGQTGAAAVSIDLDTETDILTADEFGNNYSTIPPNAIKLYSGGTNLTSGVTFGPTTQTSAGLTANVAANGTITYTGTFTGDTAIFDFSAVYQGTTFNAIYTLSKSKKGSSAVFLDIAADNQVVFATSAGTGYTLPGTQFARIYRGGTVVTSGVSFGPASTTKNGLTLTVDSSSGLISLGGASPSWTSDFEEFTITATFESNSYTKKYTISKNKQGIPGVASINGGLTNPSHVVIANNSGENFSLGTAGGTFQVASGTGDVTTSSSFSIVGGTDSGTTYTKTQNNLTLTLNKTTGVYTLSGSTWNSEFETFTLSAVYSSATITRVYTISKTISESVVEVTTTRQGFNYTTAGVLTGTSTATVTATVIGRPVSQPYYEFLIDNATVQNSTTNTYTYTAKSSFSDMPDALTVKLRDGSSTGSVLGTDFLEFYGVPAGAKGDGGQSQVKGISFLKSATQPSIPSGGSYSSPTATGWSDGIPAGNDPLWMTTRIFTSDGLSPQQSAWTQPQKTSELGQGQKAYFSTTSSGPWSETASSNSEWMRIDTVVGGVTTVTGVPVKIKGEQGVGLPGNPGLANFRAYAKNTSNITPPAYSASTTHPGSAPTPGVLWTDTPPSLSTGEVQWQIDGSGVDGLYNIITWKPPYLSYFKVGSLDAITATIGTFTSNNSGNGYVQIKDSKITVFAPNNSVRVIIGNLS